MIIALIAISLGFISLIFLAKSPIITPDGEDTLRMAAIISEKGCISYFHNCSVTNTDLGPFYPFLNSFFYKFKNYNVEYVVYFQTFIHIVCCLVFTNYLRNNYRLKNFELFFYYLLLF